MGTEIYDPYNDVSFVELNKHRRGDYTRYPEERIENRTPKPSVKKIYLKRNGDDRNGKGKLFIWRQWKLPGMKNLLEEAGLFAGLDEPAVAIYNSNGRRITHEDDIRELDTYFVTGDETLILDENDEEYFSEPSYSRNRNQSRNDRYTSLSAPEERRQPRAAIYENMKTNQPPTPPPPPYTADPIDYSEPEMMYSSCNVRKVPNKNPRSRRATKSSRKLQRPAENDYSDYEEAYRDAIGQQPSTSRQAVQPTPRQPDGSDADAQKRAKTAKRNRSKSQTNLRRDSYGYEDYQPEPQPRRENRQPQREPPYHRSVSANGDVIDPTQLYSDFDHEDAIMKDRAALAKHKEKMSTVRRTRSAVIYNRKDQTAPDAYIIYVFLNGNGMECQYVNFQKSQLQKGMNYVMELCARRFNVNPSKLCDMDGRKITEVNQLMSRGAYVVVPAGQSFRDQWYFLPDNAIDTSTNEHKVEERSAQRDRLIQRRDKRSMPTKPGLSYSTSYDQKNKRKPNKQQYDSGYESYGGRISENNNNSNSYNYNSAPNKAAYNGRPRNFYDR